MKILKDIDKLCTPAHIYLGISLLSVLFMGLQNILSGKKDRYCVGMFSCKISNVILVFVAKLIYILFWTIVLNSLCVAGYKQLSWFLVLLPFILFFILIGLLLINQGISISK